MTNRMSPSGAKPADSARPSVLHVMVGASRRAGGPPPFVGGSARELAELGLSVRILATDLARAPWGLFQIQGRVQADQIDASLVDRDLHLFPARFPRRLAFSPALRRALRRTVPEFDVVHIHNLWQFPQYAAFKSAREAGVPYVVSPHGALDPYLRRHGGLRKRAMSAGWQNEMLNGAALIHVTTAAEERLISDIAPDVPRAVVPCGLDVDDFSVLPPGDAFRQKALGGFDGPVILFLGRVTQKKGVDVLIRSFARARAAVDARLVIVGPDDERLLPPLRRLARELALEQDVIFHGPAYGEERLAALAAADVWALSSHTENFGIAVTEAMAAGCAVVISPEVNLADAVAESDAGIVADLNPEAFGHALLDLIVDQGRRARLEHAARAFAERYDWGVVAPELQRMYAGICRSQPGSPCRPNVSRSFGLGRGR